MVRSRVPCPAVIAARAIDFYKTRASQFMASGHAAISTDYVIRGLAMRRRDADLMRMGFVLGTAVGQPQLSERCRQQLESSGAPCVDHAAGAFTFANPERLTLAPTDAMEVNELIAEALSNTADGVAIQVAKVEGYGRGIVALRRLPRGVPVFAERAMFVARRSAQFCSQCLAPVGQEPTTCDGAKNGCTESYCSTACRAAAADEGHGACCGNLELRAITAQLQRDVASERRGNATVALGVLVVINMLTRAVAAQVDPLTQPGVDELCGSVSYDPATTLDQTGALVVQLGAALSQPLLNLEHFLTLFAKVQSNEFVSTSGSAVYRCLSMLNHSCVPNATVVVNEKGHAVLTPLVDIAPRQQLLVDYTGSDMQKMSFAKRSELLSQRHFQCMCPRCVQRI